MSNLNLSLAATSKDLFEKTVQAANQSVDRTPGTAAGVKQAGVVDSGEKVCFYIRGFLRWLNNEPLEYKSEYC